MIKIKQKSDCCGCEACVQVCPKRCIQFTPDDEGFKYPMVDNSTCIKCGLCVRVCPVINQSAKRDPLKIFAVKNKDETVRLNSSSGGLFNLLAQSILNENGVVFGARFNERWGVEHDYIEDEKDLRLFRGSKYVQSKIGTSYKTALQFLKQNRKVLFSGTPCQIAGLHKFLLGKRYENLITVDIICHGTPSPDVWERYLEEVTQENKIVQINNINFRAKPRGWKKFHFLLEGTRANNSKVEINESLHQNIYMMGFLKDLYLRPSCHDCPAKSLKCGSDIMLADFWGIDRIIPEFNDNKGITLAIISTEKGNTLFSKIDKEAIEVDDRSLQPVLFHSVKEPEKRNNFFQEYNNKQKKLWSIIPRLSQIKFRLFLKIYLRRLIKKIF